LGGGVDHVDAPGQALAPAFFYTFKDPVDPRGGQNRDLDWGDSREIKLTYDPGGPWSVSLGARFGKTNAFDKGSTSVPHKICLFGEQYCNPEYHYGLAMKYRSDYALSDVYNKEEHMVADFSLGRDVGIGMAGEMARSRVEVGIRYAHLQSGTVLDMTGIPDWQVPAYYAFSTPTQHHLYNTSLSAKREFEGVGPVLSWDGSRKVLGNDDTGHIAIDWSVRGGLLFGKQITDITGSYRGDYFDTPYSSFYTAPPKYPPTTTVVESIGIHRRNATRVPVLDLGLGLAYEMQRIKIGAGYRWERYFNAIDAGYTEHKSYDRTIDGPYFKIAVGFGG
jgi:hypothetical protein